MKILWFTWKDRKNPAAGGAEAINEAIAKRLVLAGHEIIIVTSGFIGGQKMEIIDGYKIMRLGNHWTVYWQAYKYYKKELAGWADLVIDEVNTIPFFCKFYVKEKNIILCYQLCRQIWFYQIFFPLNLLGWILEPLYLHLLNDRFVLTESQSTRIDMQKYGFKKDKIAVFNIGLDFTPIDDLNKIKKFSSPTILILGSLRSMKRPLYVIKTYKIASKKIPDLKLIIAGDAGSRYGQKVLRAIKGQNGIVYEGRVNNERKIELMQRCHLICVTSVKEGWGIIVTEANSQGTPAIVYDVDGLRDAVKDDLTGIVCEKNTPRILADNIVKIFGDKDRYNLLRQKAWEDSKTYTHDNSFGQFSNNLKNIINQL
ncbi:MAG: glycosyltransferase family 4 protein [Candidatus Parcubacteria bacterium]|nr:glycosyltransferase family 4 protein [Candidatus Parcubacteria bacterium]